MAYRLLPSDLVRWWRGVAWCGLATAVVAVVVGASRADEVSRSEGTGRPATADLWQSLDGNQPAVAKPPPARDVEGGRDREVPTLRVSRLTCDTSGVRLATSGLAKPIARILPPADGVGPRIYVDVPGAVLEPGVPREVAGRGGIRRVRAAQFDGDTTRIVIELAKTTPYTVHVSGRALTIALAGAAPEPRAVAAQPRAKRTARTKAKPRAMLAAAVTVPPPAEAATASPIVPHPIEETSLAAPVAVTASDTPDGVMSPLEAASSLPSPTAAVVTRPAAVVPTTLPPVEAAPAPAVRPAASTAAILTVNGVVIAWPDLAAPEYADPEAEPYRVALERWRDGIAPSGPTLVDPRDPGAMYLAADLAALRAAVGLEDTLNALGAYERALRVVPDFPDALRAQLMVGYLNLQLGFAPEATAAFNLMVKKGGALVPYAKLGLATALRMRHRPEEARKALNDVLPTAQGDILCRARLEEARIASAAGQIAPAADLYRRLASSCPGVLGVPGALGDYAEAIAAAGGVDEARRLLAQEREARAPEEEAGLDLLAGRLATEAGDLDGARAAYARVTRMTGVQGAKLEAQMRLALLENGSHPDRAAAALAPLTEKPAPIGLRATVLGEAADATARSGKLAEALAMLDKTATLGPEAEAQADRRRAELLGRLLAQAVERHDPAGVATIYAAYATQVDALAPADDRLTIAGALGRFGLHDAAAQLLGQGPDAARPALAVARAEALLAAGEAAAARSAALPLLARNPSPDVAARAQRVAVEAAIAAGDLDGAAEQVAKGGDPALRAEVARALADKPGVAEQVRALIDPLLAPEAHAAPPTLLAVGDAALAAGLAEQAATAYGRALDQGAEGNVRTRAAAGLAQVASARGDRDGARTALAIVAEADPLAKRAVAALDRTHVLDAREADAH